MILGNPCLHPLGQQLFMGFVPITSHCSVKCCLTRVRMNVAWLQADCVYDDTLTDAMLRCAAAIMRYAADARQRHGSAAGVSGGSVVA